MNRRLLAILVGTASIAAACAASASAAPALRVTTANAGTPTVGKATAVRVTVRNPSRMRATRVVLRFSAPASLRLVPARRALGTLVPGKARTVTVKATPRSAAGLRARVRVVVSAPKFRPAVAVARLVRSTGTTPPADPMVGRVFTHFTLGVLGITPPSYDAVAFLGSGWAYWGMPDGGLPTCTARTGVAGFGDASTNGCVPYTYDAATKKLTLDGHAVTLGASDDGTATLAWDDTTFVNVPVVPAGARYNVELTYTFVYGFSPNQSVSQRWLAFSPDGRFLTSGLVTGSTGYGDFQTGFSASQPDQRGTYAFTAPGRLTLTFDDGTVVNRTAIAALGPAPGQAYDPWKHWMVLDGSMYVDTGS